MEDYIPRKEAIMAVCRARLPDTTEDGIPIANGKRSVTDCVRRLKEIPAADVRPVKRGKWIIDRAFGNDVMSNEQMVICSACHKGIFWGKQNFCPNCGADMREGS